MNKTRNNIYFSSLGNTINKFEIDFSTSIEKGLDYMIAFIFGSCQEYINRENKIEIKREELIWPNDFKAVDLGSGFLLGFVVNNQIPLVDGDSDMVAIFVSKEKKPVKVFTLDLKDNTHHVCSKNVNSNDFGELNDPSINAFLEKVSDIIKKMEQQ